MKEIPADALTKKILTKKLQRKIVTPQKASLKSHSSHSHPAHSAHPDHHKQILALNKISGQIRGIQKMIEGHRYCVDILIQIRAATAALKKVESSVLKSHINHCVKDAFREKSPTNASKKVEELLEVLEKF